MDRSVKMAAAVSVLLGGIVVALLFRHESPQTHPTAALDARRLVVRKYGKPPAGSRNISDKHRSPLEFPYAVPTMGHPAAKRLTVVRPTDSSREPPTLAKSYPQQRIEGTSRWGASIGLHLPQVGRPDEPEAADNTDGPVQTHKIVDGDTLEALARRYLGATGRYLEIYEANRDLLPSPQLLPIGAELKIPPRRERGEYSPAASNSGQIIERPLVPVVP